MSGGLSAILVDLFLDAGTVRVADRDLYITEADFAVDSDMDYIVSTEGDYLIGSGTGMAFYKKALINAPSISRQLPNEGSGIISERGITLHISDNQDTIDDTWLERIEEEDIRGVQVKVYRYDEDTAPVFQCWGKITGWTYSDYIELTVTIFDNEAFEVELPLHTVTADRFTIYAEDAGAPVNICFGHCIDVPLALINNDTVNDRYDYLIGYGVIEGVWEDAGNNRGVRRNGGGFDQGTLVDTDDYTFYDGSQVTPYPGYAFIRFDLEQRDFSGNLLKITADIKGLELGGTTAERNFAWVIYNFLTNSTWGLGRSADLVSFTAAAAYLSTDWKCDGFVSDVRQAGEIINDLLFACRGTLDTDLNGDRTISIAQTGTSVGTFTGGYRTEVTSRKCLDVANAIKTLTVKYGHEPGTTGTVNELKDDVHTGFGVDSTVELRFVEDTATAKRIWSYIRNLQVWSYEFVDGIFSLDFKDVRKGEIITLTDKRKGVSGDWIVWEKTTNNRDQYRASLRKYSDSIYSQETLSTPTALVIGGVGNDLRALIGDMTISNAAGDVSRIVIKPGGQISTDLNPASNGGTLITATKLAGYKDDGTPVFVFDYDSQEFEFDGSVLIGTAFIKEAMIDNLAVTGAKIGNLEVDSAKIANLTVGTGKITNNAITNSTSDYVETDDPPDIVGTGGAVTLFDEYLTVDAAGEIWVWAAITNYIDTGNWFAANIIINSTTVFSTAESGNALYPNAAGNFTFPLSGSLAVASGSHRIRVQWASSDSDSYVNRASFMAMGIKK